MFDELIEQFLLMHRDGLCVIDDQTKEILYADSRMEQFFGTSLVGQSCYRALFGRAKTCACCPTFTQGEGKLQCCEMLHGGSPKSMFVVSSALMEQDGRKLRVCRFQDMSEYFLLVGEVVDYTGILRREASEQGFLDLLTGLGNRNCFLDRKQRLYTQCNSWGVIYFDINNMKEANDVFGHERGDALLLKAAAALSELKRDCIDIYRIGGDEFLAIAPDCDEKFMLEVMQQWQLVNKRLASDEDGLPCAVATGMAFGAAPETLDSVIRRADVRMYTDKRRQKNHAAQTPPQN